VAFIKKASPKEKDEYKAFKKVLTEKYGARSTEDTSGKHWRAEWRFPVAGSPQPDSVVLESEMDVHGCKLTYSTSRFAKAEQRPVKRDL
jgi:hypothetical protein